MIAHGRFEGNFRLQVPEKVFGESGKSVHKCYFFAMSLFDLLIRLQAHRTGVTELDTVKKEVCKVIYHSYFLTVYTYINEKSFLFLLIDADFIKHPK